MNDKWYITILFVKKQKEIYDDKLFKLKKRTDWRSYKGSRLTTFFAMSILPCNPQMLAQTGMPAQGVFLATITGAVAGTLMMASEAAHENDRRLQTESVGDMHC